MSIRGEAAIFLRDLSRQKKAPSLQAWQIYASQLKQIADLIADHDRAIKTLLSRTMEDDAWGGYDDYGPEK